MICCNERFAISLQNSDLKYTYPFDEDFTSYSFDNQWHEEVFKERGQIYVAPIQLVEWS